MSSVDRRPYLTAPVLDQFLLDDCADNFETKIEMIVDIERPDGAFIRASDRNKYVGGTFYEALLTFPLTSRTLGEWLSPALQFSNVTLELSNADGRFNDLLPGGDNYDSFVGREITVSIGLSETEATYNPIFSGSVTAVGGVTRGRFSITFIARDRYEKLNTNFPKISLTRDSYAFLEEGNIGKLLPVIYGDWTSSLEPDPAAIPAIALNGADVNVNGGTDTAPNANRYNVQFIISENANVFFDKANVYLLKSDAYYKVPENQIVSVSSDNRTFSLVQGGAWLPDNEAYFYSQGDSFFVRVKGKLLGSSPSLNENPVAQAMDILLTQTEATFDDFDFSWIVYRDKSSPPESAVSQIKSRVWADEEKPALEYALSLLEQVRLEAFINKNLKIQINPLHFESFVADPPFVVKNRDVIEGSLEVSIDDQHNFNRCQAVYDYRPNRNEESRTTRFARNDQSIAQVGQEIAKRLTYPNLYDGDQVEMQMAETLKMASAFFEIVDVTLTWRALLLDLGDFVMCDFAVGSIIYSQIPCMIRDKGYNPEGFSIPLKLWSMQLLPFNGYEPGYDGTTGGFSASITYE